LSCARISSAGYAVAKAIIYCAPTSPTKTRRGYGSFISSSLKSSRHSENSKAILTIRPLYHQSDHRIEAHIFVAFLAYCLQVTLKQRLRALAPGLTPRAVLEKFAALQMVDVHLPTTDGRYLILPRYTQPDRDQQLLLKQLQLKLPDQPPPRITLNGQSVA
jgi:hypothetical protein